MASRDPASRLKVVHQIADAHAASASVNATGVDVAGWNHVLVVCELGDLAVGGTLTIGESADNSSWANVTGASMTIADTDDDTVKVGSIDVRNLLAGQAAGTTTSCYIRSQLAVATGTGAADIAVSFVLIGARDVSRTAYAPQTYDFAV